MQRQQQRLALTGVQMLELGTTQQGLWTGGSQPQMQIQQQMRQAVSVGILETSQQQLGVLMLQASQVALLASAGM
jgi:hypothetical protein